MAMKKKAKVLDQTADNRDKWVLVIDDDEIARKILEHSLHFLDYSCETAETLTEGKQKLTERDYFLIVSDLNLPDGNGSELLFRDYERNKETPIIVISDQYNLEQLWRVHSKSSVSFLIKPITLLSLRNGIEHALRINNANSGDNSLATGGEILTALGNYWTPVFEKMQPFVMMIDKNYRVVNINRRYAEFLNTTPAEIRGKICHQFIADLDQPCEDCPYLRSNERGGKTINNCNYRVKRNNEALEASVIPLAITADDNAGAILILRNVTEENLIIGHMLRLMRAMNRTHEAVLILSGDGDVLFANDAFLTMFGFTAEEIQFEALAALFTDEKLYSEFKFALDDGGNYTHNELPLRRRSGEILPVRFLANKVADEDGEIVIVHIYDVSVMIERQKFKERNDRLQGVLEMAGSTCHLLNQPLQAIYLYASLMQKNISTAPQAGNDKLLQHALKISHEATKMNQILRKFAQINQYETLNYIDHGMIVDIDNAIKPATEGENNVQ